MEFLENSYNASCSKKQKEVDVPLNEYFPCSVYIQIMESNKYSIHFQDFLRISIYEWNTALLILRYESVQMPSVEWYTQTITNGVVQSGFCV